MKIVMRNEEFQRPNCKEECAYIFKISAEVDTQLVLHLKSKHSVLELKQHEVVTDFLDKQEDNHYMWTHVVSQPLVLDIHVLGGDLEAKLINSQGMEITKSSGQGQKLLHFYV